MIWHNSTANEYPYFDEQSHLFKFMSIQLIVTYFRTRNSIALYTGSLCSGII